MRRYSPPPWRAFALVVVLAVAVNVATGAYAQLAPPISLAFWGFIIALAGWIWNGVKAAGEVTLHVLAVSVNLLWGFAREIFNGLRDFGRDLLTGFRESWRFLRTLYEDVLKPAWVKFWKFIDWAKDSLDRVFRPVFKVLFRIRAELLKFYDKWIRPILDTIDVARKVLRVFSSLGLDWAKKLDQKLGQIEEKIDAPFRLLLREINRIINLVNTV
ncbi:MAG TPA: hypothetical protein VGJ39_01190, partial [Vicinamibacterales bacterium]